MPIYLNLLITFFKIGLFSFGGGYGMLPLMEQESIGNGWLSAEQFMNFVAISESTPGPIAVNMATFIGSSQGGVLGAALATLGAILPSFIIILLIVSIFKSFLQYRGVKCVMSGIKPVIVGLIFTTGVTLAVNIALPNLISGGSLDGFSLVAIILMAVLAAVRIAYKKLFKKNISAIILILIAAAAGMLFF